MRRGGAGIVAVAGCFSLLVGAVCLGLSFSDRSLSLALGVVAALAAALCMLVEPYLGLVLFTATVYLRPADRFPALEPARLTLVLAVGTGAVWFAQYCLVRRPKWIHHPVNRDFLGLSVVSLISHIPISIRGGITTFIEGYAKSMAIAIFIINLVRTPLRQRLFAWAVVLFTAVNGVWSIYESRIQDTIYGERVAGVGILGDPNDLALTLVMALPLAIALLCAERGFYKRLTLAAVIVALVAGVMASASRGGYLGLATVFFLEGYDRLRGRKLRLAYTICYAVVGLVAINALFAARGASLSELSEEGSAMNRRGAWVAGLRMLTAHPLTGVGLYQFPERVDDFAPRWMEQHGLTAHNSLVLVAGELGLPGLFFFCALLWRTWSSAQHARELLETKQVTRTQWYLARALRRMCAGWFVCAFFLSQAYQFWLYVAVGLTVASEQILVGSPELEEAA